MFDINISENAYNQISLILNKRNAKALLITLEAKGCAGITYKYEFLDEVTENYYFKEIRDIIIAIPKKAINRLNNLNLDFESSITRSKFVIINPNAKITCKCGTSFRA